MHHYYIVHSLYFCTCFVTLAIYIVFINIDKFGVNPVAHSLTTGHCNYIGWLLQAVPQPFSPPLPLLPPPVPLSAQIMQE